jgi:hypothetical protein
MEDLEKRVEELESLVRYLMHDSVAQDLVMKAIITTHSNRVQMQATLGVIANNHADQVREMGFERGMSPAWIASAETELKPRLAHWMQWLEK